MKQMVVILLLVGMCFVCYADPDSDYILANYRKADYRVPMRDGIHLFTSVYSPKDTSRKYPLLIFRTPYSVAYDDKYKISDLKWYIHLVKEGYIIVFQDVRGRFMSEGEFTNMTPHIANKKSNNDVDESSDTYDTIEWLLKHVANHNGKVGLLGISYRGFYATAGAIDAHPALKAVSPQAPIADFFFDDFHHNGAFLFSYFHLFHIFGIPKVGLHKKRWYRKPDFGTKDGYHLGMQINSLQQAGIRFFDNKNVFWQQIVAHPNYDEYWQKRNILPHLKNIRPAVMTVAGWYDAEDLYGSFQTFYAIEKQSPKTNNILVAGPWVHGGWVRTTGRNLGKVYFGEEVSEYYRYHIELPFFNYFLKGKGTGDFPKSFIFETGSNRWHKLDTWPPRNTKSRRLYLNNRGKLSERLSPSATSFRSFVSDPAKPVPHTQAITLGMTKEYMTDDQRFASRRADVLVYQSDILEQDMTIVGPIKACLQVSTSQSDADWVVKLIDVYPDDHPGFTHIPKVYMGGYQQMVRSEVMRGRFRNSFVRPQPFVANQVTKVEFNLQDICHTFRKGHRIMVHVQSTWFPLIDRNPQKYVDNIFLANKEDFTVAEHRVHCTKKNPSYLQIQIWSQERD